MSPLPHVSMTQQYSITPLSMDDPVAKYISERTRAAVVGHRAKPSERYHCPAPLLKVISVERVLNPFVLRRYTTGLDELVRKSSASPQDAPPAVPLASMPPPNAGLFGPGIWSGPGTPIVCENYGRRCCGQARQCGVDPSPRRADEPLRVLGHNHKTGSWLVGAMLLCATQQLAGSDAKTCARASGLCRVSTWDGYAAESGLRAVDGARVEALLEHHATIRDGASRSPACLSALPFAVAPHSECATASFPMRQVSAPVCAS